MYERGEVFRSDNMDAQVDLGLTSFSTIKEHFHVTTVKLRFSLPLFVDNLWFKLYFICINSIQEHQYMYKKYQSEQFYTNGIQKKVK